MSMREKHINILLVTQRASDYNEAYRAMQYLNTRECGCMLYFYGVGNAAVDGIVIQQIKMAVEKGQIEEVAIKSSHFRRIYRNTKRLNDKNSSTEKVRNISISDFLKSFEILKLLKPILIGYQTFQQKVIGNRNIISKLFRYFGEKILQSNFFQYGKRVSIIFYLYRRNIRLFRKFFKRRKVDIIILFEDVVGLVTSLMIKVGHEFNIPSLIIPYTIANQEEAFQALKSMTDFSMQNPGNRIVGFFFRSWVRKDKHHKVLRLPAPYVLGHVFSRTCPPDPWMVNSGYANAIAVENESMLTYYLKAGIKKKKLKVVGSFSDDYLAKYYNNRDLEIEKLGLELSITIKKPILLIGGCPNQSSGAIPPRFDFENTEQMVEFICRCLQPLSEQYQFIFRPHPNFLELSALFEKQGFVVTAIDTARLVALSSIYVAFASATIRWAIACGIPVINYDVFHYDFSDYKNVKGVVNVTLKHEFKEAIASLYDHNYCEELRQAISEEKNKWGILDGQSGDRIYQLIETLCALDYVPRIAG